MVTANPRYKKLARWQSEIPDVEIEGLKFKALQLNSEYYRVETRIMSVQPTPKALMAMIEFFIGYLYRTIYEDRQLRPLSSLREERLSVVRSGFDAKTHFNITETIRNQLDFAHKGLSNLGVKSEFLSILDKRLEHKITPGDMWLNYGRINSMDLQNKHSLKCYLIFGKDKK